MLFFIIEAAIASWNPRFGHTTGIIVILGIFVSWVAHKITQNYNEDKLVLHELRFQEGLFFDLILPLIIFPSGYNMRRKKFFSNIGTIMKFGFFGTMICFVVYTAMTYACLEAGMLTKWSDKDNMYVKLEMQMFEVISVCSLLCSSDVIAAISMINYKDQPKLFSIVYGEGVFNDIVSIILFNTVQGLKNTKFTSGTPFIIIG